MSEMSFDQEREFKKMQEIVFRIICIKCLVCRFDNCLSYSNDKMFFDDRN